MDTPKYKVGDTFRYSALKDSSVRTIEKVYPADNGVWYLVSFSEAPGCREILKEGYIREFYEKFEPFFEVGKKYTSVHSKRVYTCECVVERGGVRIAWLVGPQIERNIIVQQEDFRYMNEVD